MVTGGGMVMSRGAAAEAMSIERDGEVSVPCGEDKGEVILSMVQVSPAGDGALPAVEGSLE